MEKEKALTDADFNGLADLIELSIKAARDMEDAAFMRQDTRKALGIKNHDECIDEFLTVCGEMWKKFMDIKYKTV